MNNGKLSNLITEKGWESYNSDQREWLIFNYLQKIDKRLEHLEKRKRLDTSIAFVGGAAGGFLAFFTSKKWGGP